jgi:hypothetical protein
MYMDKKRERRHKRREYTSKWRENKLQAMSPEERTEIIERINRKKFEQRYAERALFF